MFKPSLTEKLKKIFDLDKVTYDSPGESQEQEACFIAIDSAKCRIVDAKQIARVIGTIHVFGNSQKLPYGYFSKKISEAAPDLTKNFFFFDFEENKGTHHSIAERSVGFHYLFDSQYDPAIGTLNQLDLNYPEAST